MMFSAFSLFSLLNFIILTKWFDILDFQQPNIAEVYYEIVPETELQCFT